MDVIGIGALNLDFIYETEDISFIKIAGLTIEEGKEVVGKEDSLFSLREKLNRFGTLRKVSPGGSASNTCHVLSLMGYEAGVMGILGEDREGDFYLKQLLYEDGSRIVRKGRTGMAYIINAENKDRSIIVFPNSNSDIEEEDIDIPYISQAKWVHMSSLVTEESLEVQKHIKELLFGKASFSIDPGEIYAKMGSKIYPLLDGMEILFISEKEIEILFKTEMKKAVKKALDMVNMVVVKKGKRGASLFTKENTCSSKPEKVEVIDNTGAGDVLNGVFLGLYMRGIDPAMALQGATTAASISTKGYGRDAYPTKDEMEALMDRDMGR